MNGYLIAILAILCGKYVLDVAVDRLNINCAGTALPAEFQCDYDPEKYKRSQEYLRERTAFGFIEDTVSIIITLGFILAGGFNVVDRFARGFNGGLILTGLIFVGSIALAAQVLNIPFSAYHTFVLEQKYGFNRTTPKTFTSDLLKGLLLSGIIGGVVFSGVVWFFSVMGKAGWLYCWGGVTVVELFLMFIAPVVIMPLFNKFVPLEEGPLKAELETYAGSQNFKMQGVFTMDGSRRSTKSNAFFTGFGRFRRIALFDTLIAKHTVDELVSVLAHEIGHYKKKHIIKSLAISVMTTGLMFFILSFFLENRGLSAAFRMDQPSIYAGLVFFGFLYTPISMVFSITGSILSRKHEYEADAFAVTTYGKPESFIRALKKLTVDNLSNLTPHPWKVFLYYSHPPVLRRIEAIRALSTGKGCWENNTHEEAL
jgi:STE24 endopeptidase